MANEQNLKPLNKRPQRERKEIARMGAQASNKIQANKKALKESAKILVNIPAKKETKSELKQYKLTNDNCTYAMALVVAQLKNALQGDTSAFNAIRDIIGEKPKDNEKDDFASDDRIININIIPANEADEKKTSKKQLLVFFYLSYFPAIFNNFLKLSSFLSSFQVLLNFISL